MSLLKNTHSIYLLFQYRYWHCTVQLAMKIPIRTVSQSSHKRSVFKPCANWTLKIAQNSGIWPNRKFRSYLTFGTVLSKEQEYRYPTVTPFLNVVYYVCFSLGTSNPIRLSKNSIIILLACFGFSRYR
jgi:hypothetical protein